MLPKLTYDVQVLLQSFVYFLIFGSGLVMAIPLGITVVEFNNQCILYGDWKWVNATYFTLELSSAGVCNFPVFLGIFACVLYPLAMSIYHGYAALKTKDPNIGYQMWAMPFLLVNTGIIILVFIASCVVSVGTSTMCDRIMEGQKMGAKIKSCEDATNFDWNKILKKDYTYSHFYLYQKESEGGSWITFLFWATQLGLCILRFVRNRKHRSKDMGLGPEPAVTGTGQKQDDLENFAAVQPTA